MGEIIRKMKGGKFVGWYLRYVDSDGHRKQRASKQPTHAEARRMLIEIEARIARGMVGIEERQPEDTTTLAELFERYRAEYCNPRCKDLAAYRRRTGVELARVSNETPKIAALPCAAIERSHVAKIRDALLCKYPAGTVRTTLTTISAALSFAVREKLIAKNPASSVTRPPAPPARVEFLTVEEVQRLLGEAERRARNTPGSAGLAWWSRWVAVSLALRLGMRKGELFGLRWQDVDIDARRLTVARSYAKTPKSGKPRHLRLPSALIPLLCEWRELCPSKEIVCPVLARGEWKMVAAEGCEHLLPELYEAAGLGHKKRLTHLLRHTFSSHFVMNGGSLLALSQILGHHDVKVTMVYAHLGQEYLAEQMERVKF